MEAATENSMLVALRILSVPSWHTPSERKIEAPKTHSLPPFHLRSPLLGLHLAPSSLLPVIWGRTPKHRGSDRLNLSFGSSNRRCTPPIVCSNPARAPRGARALLLYDYIVTALQFRYTPIGTCCRIACNYIAIALQCTPYTTSEITF